LFTDQPLEKDVLLETLEENFREIEITNDRSKSIFQCIIQDVNGSLTETKSLYILNYALKN